ncbi:MAG: YceI family protein, partial [Acidimicrobiales bacterium]
MSTATIPSTITGTYELDPTHSRIGFVARHAMVTKVRGSFNEFAGAGYFDAEDPSRSHLELTIQASSIDTRNADRDGHLRSNDFFAMDEHPEIRFA